MTTPTPGEAIDIVRYAEVMAHLRNSRRTSTGAQGQASAGSSVDVLILLGPHNKCGATGIFLEWHAVALIDKAFAIPVAGVSIGTLQPSEDNNGRPRPYDGD
jgi:hypothetical protein